MSNRTTITFSNSPGYAFQVGDIIVINPNRGRLKRLVMLFTKPRHTVVSEVTTTTLTMIERRMTWAEWRAAVWETVWP